MQSYTNVDQAPRAIGNNRKRRMLKSPNPAQGKAKSNNDDGPVAADAYVLPLAGGFGTT